MIRIDLTRQPSRARCQLDGQRYEATGSASVYKLATLLWLHGHGGAHFEVYDDVSPFGKPGGLAMTGRVRNWGRLVSGKPKFTKDAPYKPNFSPNERDMISRAAGQVSDATEIDSPRPDNARTAATRPSGYPNHPQGQDRARGASAPAQGVETGR